jgi:hypothetical protein
MQQIIVKGTDVIKFLNFLEDQQDNGQFKTVDYKEIVSASDESTGDADIVSIILGGAVSAISALIIDYLSRGKKNEITFDLEKEGKKLSVTIKDMSIEEVKQAMRDFLEK